MTPQLPLFPDADPEPNDDDRYRELLQASWDESLAKVISEYGIPPWCDSDNLLDQDEYRILTAVDESGCGWVEGERCVVSYDDDKARYVPTLCRATGFNAEANFNAVLNRCIEKGYLERLVVGVESRLMIGVEGRWRLDATEENDML